MKRIAMVTLLSAAVLPGSVEGCHKNDTNGIASAAISADTSTAQAWYEVLPAASSATRSASRHELVIHGLLGNPDSIVAETSGRGRFVIYGVRDSVSNSGTPHTVKVGPGPKQ